MDIIKEEVASNFDIQTQMENDEVNMSYSNPNKSTEFVNRSDDTHENIDCLPQIPPNIESFKVDDNPCSETINSVICDKCLKTFKSKKTLKVHVKVFHEQQQTFFCEDCKKSFNCIDGLNKHSKSHLDGSSYHCHLCDKKYRHSHGLKRHIQQEHLETKQTKQEEKKCSMCDYQGSVRALETHMRRQHKETDLLSCPHCEYKTKRSDVLKRHLKVHTQGKETSNNITSPTYSSFTFSHRMEIIKEEVASNFDIKTEMENDEVNLSYSNPNKLTEFVDRSDETHENINCLPHIAPYIESLSVDDNPNSVICDQCLKTFKSKKTLKVHVKVFHEEQQTFFCEDCGKSFNSIEGLKKHSKRHTAVSSYQCNFCDKKYRNSHGLKRHIQQEHLETKKKKEKKCSMCDYQGSVRALETHMRRQHKEMDLLSCPHCEYKTKRSDVLKKHIKSHTQRKNMDIVEEDIFTTLKVEMEDEDMSLILGNNFLDQKEDLFKQEVKDDNEENCSGIQIDTAFVDCKVEVNSDNEYMDCEIEANSGDEHECMEYKKETKSDDKIMDNVVQREEEIEYSCKLCDYRKNKKNSQHLKSIHGGIKYDCQLCDYKAKNKNNLNRHIKSAHEGIMYDCQLCEYKTNNKGNLNQHIKSAHEGIKIDCHLCDYKASHNGNLNQHVKSVHEGIKYDCHFCDYKATLKRSLAIHIQSVHEENKYDCPLCDYKTTFEGDLNTHVKSVHNGIKYYDCNLCDYKTIRKSSLTQHWKTCAKE